jgi:flagellar hook protein FlgE
MISAINSAMSGLTGAVDRFDRASSRLAQSDPPDLIGDRVEQLVDKHAFEANLSTIRTADEMLGSVIDIFA